MTLLEKIKLIFKSKGKDLNDEDIKLLNLNDEEEETEDEEEEETKDKKKKKTKDKKKKKKKDEDPEETEDEEEENEDEEEEENKDKKKKKNKDAAIKDALIKDAFEKGKKEMQKQFLDGMNDVAPIMDSFKPSEIKDKTPCEIKAMFIKRVSDTEIKDSDPGLNAVFNMLLKNYENPAYKNAFKTNESESIDVADQISNISFNKKKEEDK